jgi:hypothetical protein
MIKRQPSGELASWLTGWTYLANICTQKPLTKYLVSLQQRSSQFLIITLERRQRHFILKLLNDKNRPKSFVAVKSKLKDEIYKILNMYLKK